MPETSCMKRTSADILRISEYDSSVVVRFEILLWLYGLQCFRETGSFEDACFIRRGKITRDFHTRKIAPYRFDKIKQLAILSSPGRIFEPGFGNKPLARITSTSNIPFLLYSAS